jgi:hypothetical protein
MTCKDLKKPWVEAEVMNRMWVLSLLHANYVDLKISVNLLNSSLSLSQV